MCIFLLLSQPTSQVIKKGQAAAAADTEPSRKIVETCDVELMNFKPFILPVALLLFNRHTGVTVVLQWNAEDGERKKKRERSSSSFNKNTLIEKQIKKENKLLKHSLNPLL